MTPEEAVDHLRGSIDAAEGLADCLDEFDGLTAYGPAIIRPLLLMRPYRDNDDYLHEMLHVTGIVESFPDEDFYREFLRTLPDLNRSSPYLLNRLLRRTMNIAPTENAEFRKQLADLDPDGKTLLRAAIEELKNERDQRKLIIGNCDLVLTSPGI
jgi:hypothetical protein